MTDIAALSDDQRSAIARYLPPHLNIKPHRPFVTLTYAQSLDSMISLGPGLRTTLSGPESKSMTHFLRLKHDAILIGAGTAKADNPSLNCRYPEATLDNQPQPVIVGSSVTEDWVKQCKAATLAEAGHAKTPWLVIAEENPKRPDRRLGWYGDCMKVTTAPGARMDWHEILKGLHANGIRSVMIEGGASVINELLERPDLVDSVIVTIAPTFLGREGVQVGPNAAFNGGQSLKDVRWCQFGQDMVLAGRLRELDLPWERRSAKAIDPSLNLPWERRSA